MSDSDEKSCAKGKGMSKKPRERGIPQQSALKFVFNRGGLLRFLAGDF